ncbi:concanavalin A-like lectin glucanase, partial [Coniophora puteana RWD-64-598 SS2]
FTTNWAGAVMNGTEAINSVTGTFSLPKPTGNGSVAIWVGMDGVSCSTLLQVGIIVTVNNGVVSYIPWYEWLPDYATPLETLRLDASDQVTLTVTATSPTSGEVKIQNKSKNQEVSTQVSSSAKLCQRNADWIVEAYHNGTGLAPLNNFGTVMFTQAQAGTWGGAIAPTTDASVYNIQQNGQAVAWGSVQNGNVIVQH